MASGAASSRSSTSASTLQAARTEATVARIEATAARMAAGGGGGGGAAAEHSASPTIEEAEDVETHRPATPDRHICAGVLSASDRSRSPDPRDPEEGGLVVEVELALAFSGRLLAHKTFSVPKDRGRAL